MRIKADDIYKVIMREPVEAAEYLQATGLLMEINRQVLHPLGLALSCTVDKETGTFVAGLELVEIEDPEGFLFDEQLLDEAAGRLHGFMRAQIPRMAERARALGFTVQPLPAKYRNG